MSSNPGTYKNRRTALIDGDILVWRASAFAGDHQEDALELAEKLVGDTQMWARQAFCTDIIVCLSGPRDENFRRECWPLYKTNRPDERPHFHRMAVEIMRENFKVFQRDALEADDCMGLLATLDTVVNPVIVSIDKDMRTVPGWHLNPDKEDFPVLVSFDQAEYHFFIQWIMGDSSDGFSGIKGVGVKGAAKLLANVEVGTAVGSIMRAYRDKGHDWTYALAMARCARILTAEWWDSEAKKPILWTPGAHEVDGLEEWMGALSAK